MKYELEFKINQMFDKNNEYDLFICSVCFALADLLKVNQEIHKVAEKSENGNSSFFFRINMGFAREAYELLKSKFANPDFTSKYLEQVTDAIDKYIEIDSIINGKTKYKTFKEHKINKNRHLIFHYPKQKEDYKLIYDVISELEKDNHNFNYYESDDANDFERWQFDFAETIQYNVLFGIFKITDDVQHESKLNDLATLTAKIINLLNLLFSDFVCRKQWVIKSECEWELI